MMPFHATLLCVLVPPHTIVVVQSYGDVRKLSFLRLLKGCLKLRVAFVEFMFMGQCGSLVLERFSAAIL